MKKSLIAVFTILIVSCQTRNDNQADIKAIHAWIANYEEAIRTADIDALLSGESETVIYLPPNQPALSGKENLRKWYTDYFNYYDPAELLLARDIKVSGDLAFLTCNYAVSVKVKHSGEKYSDNGKIINILKREHPGKWICIYSIWNSNNLTIDFHSKIPADFTGEWELDLARSTPVPGILSSKMIITQNGNNISIERSYEVKDKVPVKSELNCTIGGESKSNSKSETLISTSFWSADKRSFTIIEKLLSAGKEYKRTTNYSLTVKGECLKVTSFDQVPHGLLIPSDKKQIVMTYNKINKEK